MIVTTKNKKNKQKGKKNSISIQEAVRRAIRANQEIKWLSTAITGQNVAQVFSNTSGHNTITVSIPAVGTGSSQRVGADIFIDSLSVKMQYFGQPSTVGRVRLRHYLCLTVGTNPTADVGALLDPNAIVSDLNAVDVYDMLCFRNPFYSTVRIIREWSAELDPYLATASGTGPPVGFSEVHIPLNGMKMEYVAGAYSSKILWILTLADCGNRGATPSTLLGLPNNAANTGVIFEVSTRLTFRDA
jgi:hypothetical protein